MSIECNFIFLIILSYKNGLHSLFENELFFIKEENNQKNNSFTLSDLITIIVKTGGKIEKIEKNAKFKIIISKEEHISKDIKKKLPIEKHNISHIWILDCISNYKILDPYNYLIK